MPQKCLDWGQPPAPLENVQIKAEKSALNNLDSGWPPSSPFGQSPNMSRFFSGLASLKNILNDHKSQVQIVFTKISWTDRRTDKHTRTQRLIE